MCGGPPISVTAPLITVSLGCARGPPDSTAGAVFVRDVQITGDKVTGDVYIAGMDENSGNGCGSSCGSNRKTSSTAPLTAVTLLPTPTPAPPSSARAVAVRASSARMYRQPRLLATHGLG